MRFRAEVGYGTTVAFRGLYRHAFASLPFGSAIAELEGGGQWRTGWSYDAALGAGVSLGPLDVLALGGYRYANAASSGQAGGPIVRGRLRLTTLLFGLGVLAEALPEQSLQITLDLVPLGIVGSLL